MWAERAYFVSQSNALMFMILTLALCAHRAMPIGALATTGLLGGGCAILVIAIEECQQSLGTGSAQGYVVPGVASALVVCGIPALLRRRRSEETDEQL